MELFLRYLASPLLAALFTALILWFKESKTEKLKQKRIINEERLTKVYNKLHVISIMYEDFLEIDWKSNTTNEHFEPSIINIEKWNEAIKQAKDIVHNNLHLLDRDEIELWNEVIHWDNGEEVMEYEQPMKYTSFKKFISSIKENYSFIYDDFYMESKKMKKKIIADYQNKIKEIEKNNSLKPSKKEKEIKRLQEKINKVKERK